MITLEGQLYRDNGQGTQVREGVGQYLRLRMASVILRREIERYREENQVPLLCRGDAYFKRLTPGSFAGLDTDFNEKDEPNLLGVRPTCDCLWRTHC